MKLFKVNNKVINLINGKPIDKFNGVQVIGGVLAHVSLLTANDDNILTANDEPVMVQI